ncbi:putative probable catechol O-methyltransferase 1 [[Candida] railenensis]|uniref:catechol O-methyltransferase n=1 Tax=[Candida] railenensis TaxID=45579 RepID=A0A9P0QV90_9ASCO|nr:putative probable catechol O-methyltransferase 1 [[Candida] railenensis]
MFSLASSVSNYFSMSDKEANLEKSIFSLPQETLDKVQGNPAKVLELIEEHCPVAMFLGREKAEIIRKELTKRKKSSSTTTEPLLFAELGCYMGYSALLLTHLLELDSPNANPKSKYYSFEISEKFASIARKFVKLAGLEDRVEIIVGPAADTLVEFEQRIRKENDGKYTPFDFVLIDHRKDLYVPDLRILESLNLVAPGTVLVGDNIIRPGAPEYHAYVNMTPEEKREYNYANPSIHGNSFNGRWNLVYVTQSFESGGYHGPGLDQIDVTECVDFLNG